MTPSPEAMKQALLADPNTPKLAAALGMPLELYVEQVMHFATNPTAEPQVLVAEDEDLVAAGHTPPSEEEIGAFLVQAATAAETAQGSGFATAKKDKVSLNDLPAVKSAAAPSDPNLKAVLDAQLRAGRAKKG